MKLAPRKDSSGRVIQIGDIVASFPKSGGYQIAQVTGIFESGRVTGKVACVRDKYAHEEGAPDITETRTGRRLKPEIAAKPRRWGQYYRFDDYEEYEYEYTHRDYTRVGKIHYWRKKQLADISLLVIRSADGTDLADLMKDVNQNWNAEVPE